VFDGGVRLAGKGAPVQEQKPTRRLAILAAVLLAGCGSSASSRHAASATPSKQVAAPVCLPQARDAVARYLRVAPSAVALAPQTGNNSMPQCSFTAHGARKRTVHVIANVNDGPQPYFVLERTAVEAAQQFTPSRMIAAPQSVTGLGIEADWFPAETQLMATDGKRLITVTVAWGSAPAAGKRALATAALRPYLRPQKNSASEAKGAPG
jgi:hypothetical protein